MIIYIHGFGSSGFGGKATLFKDYFEDKIIMPSLSYVPKLAIHTLEQLIEMLLKNGQNVNLVGSSLGGFYSLYLANKYELKAVLINPSIYPFKTLDKLGMSTNYYDFSSFEVLPEHVDTLKHFEVKNIKNEKNFIVLLQKDDEVLDYSESVNKLPNSTLYVEEGGNHSFENIQRYFKTIDEFFS